MIKPVKIAILSCNHGHAKGYYPLKNDPMFELVAVSIAPDYAGGEGMEQLLKSIETALGHSRHHVQVTLPYSMGGMVETLHSGAQVLSVDYTGEGIVVEAILDPILYGRLKEYITKEL